MRVKLDILRQRQERETRLHVPAEPLSSSPVKLTAEEYTYRLVDESLESSITDLSPGKKGDKPTTLSQSLPEPVVKVE
jgi:hypothetical protein